MPSLGQSQSSLLPDFAFFSGGAARVIYMRCGECVLGHAHISCFAGKCAVMTYEIKQAEGNT